MSTDTSTREGADHRGKGDAGVDPEHGDGHGNGQLEVVGGGGKGEGGGLLVAGRSLESLDPEIEILLQLDPE